MLIGEYKYTIDAKKRLALPSKFRKELGKTVIVTKGIEKCLYVYTGKEWKIMSEKLGKMTVTRLESRDFSRTMLSGAMEVNLDKLGRILIPDYLKEYAGLKKDVVIFGLSIKLEVWDGKEWGEYKRRMKKKLPELVSKLGELGI